MTTEQMALVKKLIQKHEIEATDAEWTLIFMGVGYGLSEQQIDSYGFGGRFAVDDLQFSGIQ